MFELSNFMKHQTQAQFQNYEEQQQMASQNESGWKTFQLTGTAGLSAFLVVDLQSDGTIAPVANGAKGIGVIQESVGFTVPTSYARVKLWSAPGTFMIQVSNTAITPGTTYSTITGGYISLVTGTGNPAWVKANGAAVASNGIVVEFVADIT